MKSFKTLAIALVAAGTMLTGCNRCRTQVKAPIGGGGGGALGAGVGALIGGGKGAAIGSAVGAAVGAGAGALIGKKMDNQAKQLEESLPNADVQRVEDQNGLAAIKVTFPGGILFPTGKYNLNASAQTELAQFANSLKQNPNTNVQIYGYTDNTGSMAVNAPLANNRADAVQAFLVNSGVPVTRITAQGVPMADYVASNDTAAGRAQNRRVEIYITADQKMIQQAEQGTLK